MYHTKIEMICSSMGGNILREYDMTGYSIREYSAVYCNTIESSLVFFDCCIVLEYVGALFWALAQAVQPGRSADSLRATRQFHYFGLRAQV